jgi:hypothetical protein
MKDNGYNEDREKKNTDRKRKKNMKTKKGKENKLK